MMRQLSKQRKLTSIEDVHHSLKVVKELTVSFLLDIIALKTHHALLTAFNSDRLPQPEPFKKFGNLLSCGQNEVGQLGFNDDVIEKTRPALVVDKSSKVVDVSAGGMHSKKQAMILNPFC